MAVSILSGVLSRRALLRKVGTSALIGSAALATACSSSQSPQSSTAVPTGAPKGTAGTKVATTSLAPTVTASAASVASSATPSSKAKLQFFGSEARLAQQAIQGQLNVFTKQSGIPVEYTVASGGQFITKLQTMMAGGAPPDMSYMDFRNFARFVFDGQLLQLDALVSRDNYDVSDFHPKYFAQCHWQGKLFANGRDFGWRQVFYNIDLFQKAGVPLPPGTWDAPGWKFADFLSTAEKLTQRDSGGRTTTWGFTNATDYFGWVYSNGGRFIDVTNTKAMVAKPSAINAFEFIHDMINKSKVAESPASTQEMDASTAFLTGRAAMIVSPTATGVITYRSIKNFKWDTAPLPMGPDNVGPRHNMGGGSCWALAAHGKHLDEAWELSKFVSGKATQTALAKADYAPSRVSVMESPAWLDPSQPPKSQEVMSKGGDYIIGNPQVLVWGQFQTALDKLLDDVWLGKQTAQEIAPQLKKTADDLMAKNQQLLDGKKSS
ncbi:MAG TPA: sugar ABC transporter substrate-binding protein [Chloroflexota bacterium]|nr:sugar ABC transporter substrate-binding protein [Chloroflexota bacterium]